jgi:type I restriction enzyme S subunit
MSVNSWVEVKLKEMCERITVGHVGSMAGEYQENGIPFLRSLNITPFRLSFDNLKFIGGNFHQKLKKSALRPGDVAVVRTGYPGTACVIPESLPESNCSDLVIVRPGKDLNPYFLAAIFNSTFGKNLVGGNLVGAAQQHFNITVAKELKLRFPAKPVQDKIAAVLSVYDDLIENNRRRVELLEQMAEELYREWFVRFRFPGYQQAKFEKGVPIGWDVAEAKNYFNYVKGKSYKGDELSEKETDIPFVTLKSFNRGGGYREEGLKRYSGKFKPEQVVNDGDIVMAVTDMTQDREIVGRVARISNIGSRGAVISLDVIKLIPREISKSYLYGYMRLSGFGRHIKEFANGTNVLHLSPEVVMRQKIIVPPEHLREKFCVVVDPIHTELDELTNICRNLLAQRDMLLPRLISGKLPVDQLDIQFPPSMREADAARQEVAHA